MKLPASNNKFTYNCDGHTFNYLVEDGFTYCIVAVESVGQQIPIAFMDRVKEDFTKRLKLKEHMQYCVDHPEEVSKLAKVKAQVSEVKGVMMENIEKVLDRGEKIEVLVDKTENLRSQSEVLKATLATDAVIGAMVLDMFSYTMSWGRLVVSVVFGRLGLNEEVRRS
uniref:Uncharacterized protein n=1 Tax=Zea mays TaxID=4577 RepID=A0A804P1I7_MAIZE